MNKLKIGAKKLLAEILATIFDILLVAILQLIFGYGDILFLSAVYVIARIHGLTRKGIFKLLTKA